MSIPVALEDLAATIVGRIHLGYLLTCPATGPPHAASVRVQFSDGHLVVGCGRTSRANAAEHPTVTLLWPPDEPGGYTLIVDGTARCVPDSDTLRIHARSAVLHRSAQ